jgi:hypothetical protein
MKIIFGKGSTYIKKVKGQKKAPLMRGFFVHTPTIDKRVIGHFYQFDGEP